MKLTWKRGVRDETITSRRMTWKSKCDRYAVQEMVSRLSGRPTVYLALVKRTIPFPLAEIIGRHRTREAASKACELDLRLETKGELSA